MTETSRIYLATPMEFDAPVFADKLRSVLEAIQVACLRISLRGDATEADWTGAVNHLLPVCHSADVALVLTDHYRLVAPLGADGVHLASSRTPLREVREILGRDRIVGAFAGSSRHQGMVLAEAGADYISFGPVGDAGTLGDGIHAADDLFRWWAEMIETPCVAEGGVTLSDATRLADYADFIVPDPTVFAAEDPVGQLAAYKNALPPLQD